MNDAINKDVAIGPKPNFHWAKDTLQGLGPLPLMGWRLTI